MTKKMVFNLLRGAGISRQVRKTVRGTRYFFVQNTASIASGATYHFDLDDRFEPYNDLLITNLDKNNNYTLTINGTIKFPLPKGNKAKIDFPVRDISATNDGSTTTSAAQINIYYRVKPLL